MSLKNPVEMLLQWAKEQPNKPWLYQPVDGVWKKYTFAECEAQVRGMATALRKLGLPAGSRIAISGRNTAHWFLADLAIAMNLADLAALRAGTLDPMSAYFSGRIRLDGDMMLAMQLRDLIEKIGR